MDHQDAQMTEILVVLTGGYGGRVAEAIEQLRTAGVTVAEVSEAEGTVTGTVESYRVKAVEAMPCVQAVRSTMTYIADFPAGDPRDRDGPDDDEPEEPDDATASG